MQTQTPSAEQQELRRVASQVEKEAKRIDAANFSGIEIRPATQEVLLYQKPSTVSKRADLEASLATMSGAVTVVLQDARYSASELTAAGARLEARNDDLRASGVKLTSYGPPLTAQVFKSTWTGVPRLATLDPRCRR